MKTYEQLMKHYWGKIVPMAEDSGINPWECVRVSGINEGFLKHPTFTLPAGDYTFTLTVLEGKPVFVGDTLYHKDHGRPIYVTIAGFDDNFTWAPPTKKRTFMLNSVELPCPLKVVQDTYSILSICGMNFYFNNWRDARSVHDEILKILNTARDKE